MELRHNGVPLGTLMRHFYETPWASAWLVTNDPALLAHYAAVCAFRSWSDTIPDDLPDAEADVCYEQEMAARGLVEADLDDFWQPWEVVMPDGERRPISPPHIEPDGFLFWRWW